MDLIRLSDFQVKFSYPMMVCGHRKFRLITGLKIGREKDLLFPCYLVSGLNKELKHKILW